MTSKKELTDVWNSLLLIQAEVGEDEFIETLVLSGADVNIQNHKGNTPLMIGCIRSHARCVSALLDAGADVNIGDSFGFSPLSWAAMTGSEACLRVLLIAGAEVNKVIDNTSIFLIAAATSWMRKCVLALIQPSVSRPGNLGDDAGCTCTTVNSNQETLDVLIRAGSDVNIISCDGLIPLSLAVIGGSYICTKHLLNAGADVNTFQL